MNTQHTPEQLREIADHGWDDPIQTHVPVGPHHFHVVTPRHPFFDQIRDQIVRQVGVSLARGLTPDHTSVCLVAPVWEPDANYLGAFINWPDDELLDDIRGQTDITQSATQANLIKINMGSLAEPDEEEKLTDIIEHETWHLIDQMGNHSNIRNMAPIGVDQEQAHRSGERQLEAEVGYNPITGETRKTLTAGGLWRSMTAQLDHMRAYANHGSEWFVHQQMCQTRGLTPGSLEGYFTTHGLLQSLLNLIQSHQSTGTPRSQLRRVWQKQVWPGIMHDRPRFMKVLRDQQLEWLLR